MSNLKAMSDTKEPKTVDVSALIAGDVQFVQVDVWTEAKGLHHVKLRVVEEVDGKHRVRDEYSGCPKCRCPWETHYQFCPRCGNKIKR